MSKSGSVTVCSDNKTNERILGVDFGSADAVEAWAPIDDRIMGGVSQSRLSFHADGYAVFAGTVSMENGGGFASVRHPCLRLGDAQEGPFSLDIKVLRAAT